MVVIPPLPIYQRAAWMQQIEPRLGAAGSEVQPPIDSRARPDSTGIHEDWLMTIINLVTSRYCTHRPRPEVHHSSLVRIHDRNPYRRIRLNRLFVSERGAPL